MKIATILIAGTALLISAPAFADGFNNQQSQGTVVINGQLNLAPVFSHLNATLEVVSGDASAASTAVGNQLMVIAEQDTRVHNTQTQVGDVGATLNAKVRDVGGDLSLSSTALCNGASISTDPRVTAVDSKQNCDAKDPFAITNANVRNVGGLVGISATAVSNQIEVDSNARNNPITNRQINRAGTFAEVNANVKNVGGVGIAATAAGNTAQIIHIGHE